ncbi:RNA 3'-terminal phosphate cyclase [Verrucomicrobia bacterium LW23]|nr:RNA 3'-terminal phosphate cyclase [Verrucomicrobia bacterium LW23]
MIHIDGSAGEGGGQILRTALALSMCTGQPFRMSNIRAGRKKPGLMRQHLTAVQAAYAITGSQGAPVATGALELEFVPGVVAPGNHTFAVGTAGSATLVLQTVLPALLMVTQAAGADESPMESTLVCQGGTHNPFAPPFDFLERSFAPVLRRMGAKIGLTLTRPGFYPAGGGEMLARITQVPKLKHLSLVEKGALVRRRALVLLACLSRNIGEREIHALQAKLSWPKDTFELKEVAGATGPGNVIIIEQEFEHVTEIVTGFGERGVSAERVVELAIEKVRRYEVAAAAGAVVGEHLADQLLVPMALAGGGEFLTMRPSRHSVTNADTIRKFLDIPIRFTQRAEDVWHCVVG